MIFHKQRTENDKDTYLSKVDGGPEQKDGKGAIALRMPYKKVCVAKQ